MPLPSHRIEIVKRYQQEEWANDYLVNAANMAAAESLAATFAAMERAIHFDAITFVYARVSTTAKFDRIFDHLVIDLPGQIALSSGIMLPLWNTLRVDFRTNDSDPSRKYFRGCLSAAQVDNNFKVIPARLTAVQTVLDNSTYSASFPAIVTPKGNAATNANAITFVQERQLHRRRKKKDTA
jgi:hypothetical protein